MVNIISKINESIKNVKDNIFRWFAFVIVTLNISGFVVWYLPRKIANYLVCSLDRFLEIYCWSIGLFVVGLFCVGIVYELYKVLFKK